MPGTVASSKWQEVAFIGAGQMARALASGLVRAGLFAGQDVVATDPVAAARDQFAQLIPGSHVSSDNRRAVDRPRIVLLAVKPQQLAALWQQPGEVFHQPSAAAADCLYVSIVAGVPLATLTAGLKSDRVVRVMPNTPCLVGVGASAYACAAGVGADEQALVQQLLETVGMAVRLNESALDAVTGLSGSGPAFVFEFLDALADGGVQAGLTRDVALQLAAQTVAGAARLLQHSGEHPGVLKDRVTSPGGTTIAGLHQLHVGGFRAAVMNAVLAATRRSQELGQAASGR